MDQIIVRTYRTRACSQLGQRDVGPDQMNINIIEHYRRLKIRSDLGYWQDVVDCMPG